MRAPSADRIAYLSRLCLSAELTRVIFLFLPCSFSLSISRPLARSLARSLALDAIDTIEVERRSRADERAPWKRNDDRRNSRGRPTRPAEFRERAMKRSRVDRYVHSVTKRSDVHSIADTGRHAVEKRMIYMRASLTSRKSIRI